MDDATLLERFEAQGIPLAEWTHRAHLKVAFLYLMRFSFEDAATRMEDGIRRLNAANQVPEAVDQGFHVTMTRAWMRIIDTTARVYGPYDDADAFVDDHPQLHERLLLRLFYSRPRICSADAKARFVEPDLAPLPTVQDHEQHPQS